jgi:transposase InsO family protein
MMGMTSKYKEGVMPWEERSLMSLRLEFVLHALTPGANRRALCREYEVSPKTAYKWIGRYQELGEEGLGDQSRAPYSSPNRTPEEIEELILRLRDEEPVWGARKIRARLGEYLEEGVPAGSTISGILLRNGRIDPKESRKHQAFTSFEAGEPNELWQMDFKGHFPLTLGGRCYPLTVLDDHSRFLLGLRACADQRAPSVAGALRIIFKTYGLPEKMIFDNGRPWGLGADRPYTALGVWLLSLGIKVSHSRPYHPQTLGKDERLHRTLKAEVLREAFPDQVRAQAAFDAFRERYNHYRPHEALGQKPPITRYEPSEREYFERQGPIEYGDGYIVRKVQDKGEISFKNRHWDVGKAFRGYPVGLLPTPTDGLFDSYFLSQIVARIDLRTNSSDQR